ncbi:MAG: 50S ribosomal protein L29 [Nitrospirae bacterium]|nr:50S ribosomal protein L29 [Nitrospirota bacterium]
MAEKDIKALRDLTSEELRREEADLRKELFNLRFQAVLGRMENPLRIREVRKSIARIKTVFREKSAG